MKPDLKKLRAALRRELEWVSDIEVVAFEDASGEPAWRVTLLVNSPSEKLEAQAIRRARDIVLACFAEGSQDERPERWPYVRFDRASAPAAL